MNSLIGIWVFTSVVYPIQWIPAPNPDLNLRLIFLDSARNEVMYFHQNQRGYCRRWANYHVEDKYLVQEVTEVDEDNDVSCAQDTDMQNANVSKTTFEIKDEKLYLDMLVGEKTIQYVFSRESSSNILKLN